MLGANIARMRSRQFTWRLAAGLILVGTAADGIFGVLFLTGIARTVSFSSLQAIYWIPPAFDRPSSLLHLLARLSSASMDSPTAYGHFQRATCAWSLEGKALGRLGRNGPDAISGHLSGEPPESVFC